MAEVTLRTCSNGTVTSVASTASAKTILAANEKRRGASVMNTSTDVLYLLLSATGTVDVTAVHTVRLASNAYYEVPFGYKGRITGISSGTNGAANVTEFE